MASTAPNAATQAGGGMTMDDMHAKPKDHLWVLAVIAAAVLAEVWASWVGIGAMSGFPRIDRIPTDWVLAVAVEAYWGYALYAWLAAAPGPRSRAMAMWSCAVVFVLSLISQVSYHELTAPAGATTGRRFVIGFASALPVIILALIAVLVHLRHLDRAEAAQAEEVARKAEQRAVSEAAAGDERTSLRAELGAARAAVEPLMADLETARSELARVTAKAEAATAKLEAQRKRNSPAKRREISPRNRSRISRATGVPDDVDARAEALSILAAEPEIKGADLGLRVGKSKRWGQLFLRGLATAAPKGQDPEE
jgi:hypothetical protein